MGTSDGRPHLIPGLYDLLLSEGLEQRIDQEDLDSEHLPLDPGDSHDVVAEYLAKLIATAMSGFPKWEALDRQHRLAIKLIDVLVQEGLTRDEQRAHLVAPLARLLSLQMRSPAESVASLPANRPDTPLARSTLLTGARRDPALGVQLRKEILTAERVDILCSFIKWSGLRVMLDELRELTATPMPDGSPRLRVLTTSYMGATDPKAVEALAALPYTELRISYDTKRTRLHAKAYLIRRATDFGSAYVGSANLSHAALHEGLEWTTKLSQYELPHLWHRVLATFESHWNDAEFEPYDKSKLRQAIDRERCATEDSSSIAFFDLHPYPFQQEILEYLAAERQMFQKKRQLIVAATGTGKTMIAAFDYKRFAERAQPSLLFIAHRRDILTQALGTFRAVLRDQNFGDLLTGTDKPSQDQHLFCMIQSYNSQGIDSLPRDHFRYVVVDEFHHSEAASYQRLLQHVQPALLLGLTATPERADGLDILGWFEGKATAELRLPDAIERRLLCPFQYFGVSDSVDLSRLRWERGGYRMDDLRQVYDHNDARASLVLQKVSEILLKPSSARAIGFCVSIAHAEFMAKFFRERGLAAEAIHADSTVEERESVRQRLKSGVLNFVFAVDLYNEGVDIPEVDTVLFLRPTESLTVYLQQLGRGLRLSEGKDFLTVLDFIGAQRKEFRFAHRFRALSAQTSSNLTREIEQGFPFLPAGCLIRLEKAAQERVLENIQQNLALRRDRVVEEIGALGRQLKRVPSIQETCECLCCDLDDLLRRGLWADLIADARLTPKMECPENENLVRSLRRLSHLDDCHRIRWLLEWLSQTPLRLAEGDDLAERYEAMVQIMLWGDASKGWTRAQALEQLSKNPAAQRSLRDILLYLQEHAQVAGQPLDPIRYGPLVLHAAYTREEVLAALGHWDISKRPESREGVLHLPAQKLDVFFVTIDKTDGTFSPTTMYKDYALSESLFHWQSQSTTSEESETGRRYVQHLSRGYRPLLFVREHQKLPNGLTCPYAFLGPVRYKSHLGSRPMSILWELENPIVARHLRWARSVA